MTGVVQHMHDGDRDEVRPLRAAGLAPLEMVHGDGCRHSLFVVPPGGGKPCRPSTWIWMDVQTHRLLAWRSGPTESADPLRLAFEDLVAAHGAPKAMLQDTILARDIAPCLERRMTQIRIVRGSGRAYLIERAFRALHEADGAYAGQSSMATSALPWGEFLAVRDSGIAAYNARLGREED